MKKLDHPNVVRMIEVLEEVEQDTLNIILEYVKNGSLMDLLKKTTVPLPMNKLRKYFRDIILGIEYCHKSAQIIHRDIKPENLLVDINDRVKISDFGVSQIMENGTDFIQNTAGSNYFFAPEICRGTKFRGTKSDIWAIGVTLYYMCYKKYPFRANEFPDLYHKIQTEEPVYP